MFTDHTFTKLPEELSWIVPDMCVTFLEGEDELAEKVLAIFESIGFKRKCSYNDFKESISEDDKKHFLNSGVHGHFIGVRAKSGEVFFGIDKYPHTPHYDAHYFVRWEQSEFEELGKRLSQLKR